MGQVEVILDSRPLCPLSPDPNDLIPLTPANFLIGRPLNAPREETYLNTAENRLKAFQRMQKLVQHFWKRWKLEYVHLLQAKTKWTRENKRQLKQGDLVLLIESNDAPINWTMGRIINLWPGADNVTRVVSVKTQNNIFKRSVNKVCLLPEHM